MGFPRMMIDVNRRLHQLRTWTICGFEAMFQQLRLTIGARSIRQAH